MLLQKHSSYAIPKKRVVFICKITTGDLSSDLNIEKNRSKFGPSITPE